MAKHGYSTRDFFILEEIGLQMESEILSSSPLHKLLLTYAATRDKLSR